MALGTLGATLLGSAVTAGTSFGLNKLFGGGSKGSAGQPVQQFRPSGFSGGGFGTSFGSEGLTITPTAERLGLVRGISDSFGRLSGELGGLRSRVAPGISDLRTQRLGEIENARSAAIGNLRENLGRRRVLGSSFGQDALTRAEAEFAGQRDRVAAESFLQELELTNQLINQQFAADRQQFQTGLDELNFEAGIASSLSGQATNVMGQNARFLSALNAQEAAGAGKFFGTTFEPVGKALSAFVGNQFGGGSPSGFFGGSPETNPNLRPVA